MDYHTALARVLNQTNFERLPSRDFRAANFDLSRVTDMLRLVGDPHAERPTLHVAGTKGKGSTSAMLASALTAAGYRTGLFTSPHLHTMCERIAVDGIPVGQETFAALVDDLWPHVEATNRTWADSPVTTFEILTALAFSCFRNNVAEAQVLEVGLGGRLDATNVVRPTVSVITSLSHDHTEILGETLAEIAAEKAGIIKEGVPVVCAPQQPEALAVIERIAAEKDAPLVVLGRDVTWSRNEFSSRIQGVHVVGEALGRPFEHNVEIPLLGAHQLENAALALTTLEVFRLQGHPVPFDAIHFGLRNVDWPGRLERLQDIPLVLADGAHNAYSAARLREAVAEYFPHEKMHLVLGASSDKNIQGIIQELTPIASSAIATRSRHPRSLDPDAIAQVCMGYIEGATTAPDVATAVGQAIQQAGGRDLILVTGSLFVVAEAREHLLGIEPEIYSL